MPGVSASTRGAATAFRQGAGSLCPGSPRLCAAGVGFLLKFFSFPTCRLGLRPAVPSCSSSAAQTSCADAPLLRELLTLEMFALALLRAMGQEQAALLATQLLEMLPACRKQRGANLVPCRIWDVPPSLQIEELMGNLLCPRINYAITSYHH